MKIARDSRTDRGVGFARAGRLVVVGVLIAIPGFAQDHRMGTSKPEPVAITTTPDVVLPEVPPAEVTPAAEVTPVPEVYLPYTQTGGDPLAVAGVRRPLGAGAAEDSMADPDAGIVTYVRSEPGEIPDGTVVKVRLREELSTMTTRPGNPFTAEVSEPVLRDGRVVIPVGAVLEGRVTYVRGGSRISGGAAIHLEPQTVLLPDGTKYFLHARVIDTSRWDNTRVDREGTIIRREHMKGTAAAFGLAAGGGATAGAMIGGIPGALIGAGVGAGAGTVVWLRQDRQTVLPKDLGVVFSLTTPMLVVPARASSGSVDAGGSVGLE